MPYDFPPARPHGELEQLFDDVFFLQGTVKMASPPLRFSRNMVVLRSGGSLTLVNSVRLTEAGLTKLDALGKVEHVVRLCGFHGMDDPFYKDRYGAKIWAVDGQRYVGGTDINKPGSSSYFEADEFMTEGSSLPIADAKIFVFDTAKPKEGMILLEREGGILVSGDPLQNWIKPDRFFGIIARVMMRSMGFIRAYNIGPGWLKGSRVDRAEFKRLMELEFEHVLPAHGEPIIGGAKAKFQPSVDALFVG